MYFIAKLGVDTLADPRRIWPAFFSTRTRVPYCGHEGFENEGLVLQPRSDKLKSFWRLARKHAHLT
jgi:hypothetical protein